MATNNNNRFIQLPYLDWLGMRSTKCPNDTSLLLPSHPIDAAGPGDVFLAAVFNKNKLAFFCDKSGRMILRTGDTYSNTIQRPVKILGKGLIASECKNTDVYIEYSENSEGGGEITYRKNNVSKITTSIKDWTWNVYGLGELYLSCYTSELKNKDLGTLKNKVHSLLLDEINNEDKWPVQNILGITDSENTTRDTLSTIIPDSIPWPDVSENELQLEYSVSLGMISYGRTERTYGRRTIDEEWETSYVSEEINAGSGICKQVSVVFPLLKGPKRVEISASIVATSSELGEGLTQSSLKDVPVYIVWGKIGGALKSDTGSTLDANMPDLGIGDKGSDGGYPSLREVGTLDSSKGMAIMLTDMAEHTCVCDIPETHIMWVKFGVDIRKLFEESKNIIMSEYSEEKPVGNWTRYTKVLRETWFSVYTIVKLRFRVVA